MPFSAVNIGTNTSTSGASVAVTVPAGGVPAGSLIVVIITEKNNATADGVLADSATNTWVQSQVVTLNATTASGRGWMYFAWNSKALVSGNTITWTKQTTGDITSISACYFSGVSTAANPEDSGARTFATGSTGTITITSGTPNTAGDLFVAGLFDSGTTTAGGNATFTQASGWATPPNEANTGGSGNARVNGGWKRGTGTSTQTYNPTLSSTAQAWGILITAFKMQPDVIKVTDLPPQPTLRSLDYSWIWARSLPVIPYGKAIYDLPPFGYELYYHNQLRTLTEGPAPQPLTQIPYSRQQDWPLPGTYPRPDETWVWPFNPNLPPPAAAQFPPGLYDQITDLPPRGYDYQYPNQLRTLTQGPAPVFVQPPFAQTNWPNPIGYPSPVQSWTYNYLLTLIGQDRFPPGGTVYTLPSQSVDIQTRTWTFSNQLQPVVAVQLPPHQWDWPNPKEFRDYRSWTWSKQLQPVVAVQLPPGQTTNQLGIGPDYPVQLRTLINSPAPVVAISLPLNQYDWPNPREFRDYRTWTWSPYVPPVVIQNLPPGKITNQLGIGFDYPVQLRTLTQGPAPVVTAVVQLPPNQYNWPLPSVYAPSTQSWTWQYNLNLIGQDQFPIGSAEGQNQIFGIPVYAEYPNQLRTLTSGPSPSIVTIVGPLGVVANQYNWPNPSPVTWYRDWYWSPKVPPVVVVQLPPGQTSNVVPIGPDYPIQLRTLVNAPAPISVAVTQLPPHNWDWPLPQTYLQPYRSWEAWYNLNLIGMDQFPVGGNLTGGQNDMFGIPVYAEYPIQLRTLTSGPSPSVIAVVQRPFNQFDWPVSRDYSYYRSWERSYLPLLISPNINYINTPFDWGLPETGPVYLVQSITENNIPLLTFVVVPLGPPLNVTRIFDLPGQPVYPSQIASIASGPAPVFVPGPPQVDLHFKHFFNSFGRMGNLGGLS